MNTSPSQKIFEQQYNLIKEHRKEKNAPVDSMGTGALDYPEDEKLRRFQILVSTMLSSQTKDEKTSEAVKILQKQNLSIEMIQNTPEEELQTLISGVRFAKNKVGYLKKTAKILAEKYQGDIPNTMEELCKLPGVGIKMAIIAMAYGWGKYVGIGVDSHVHRVANRLAWVQTEKSEQTQKELEAFVPSEKWKELSGLLIGFGQQICKQKNPSCEECQLKEKCTFYQN